MPSNETAPLFAAARQYGIGFHLGYAEIAHEPDATGTMRKHRFNTSILVNRTATSCRNTARCICPDMPIPIRTRNVQHLEKRYFEAGNLGFTVVRAPMGGTAGGGINMGMLICNDRRWPEALRVFGLQRVELVMMGYNTPSRNMRPPCSKHSICARSTLICRSRRAAIRTPASRWGWPRPAMRTGRAVRPRDHRQPAWRDRCHGDEPDDELIIADCNLDMCTLGRTTIFAFDKHRRPEAYTRNYQPGRRGCATLVLDEEGGGLARHPRSVPHRVRFLADAAIEGSVQGRIAN